MRQTAVSIVLLACLLCACAGESRAVDRTDPGAVAEAWIRAWFAGTGNHQQYEFETIPETESDFSRACHEFFAQGTPIAALTAATGYGVSGNAKAPEVAFELDNYNGSLRRTLARSPTGSRCA